MTNINNINNLPPRVKKALDKLTYDDAYSYTEYPDYVELIVNVYGDIEIYKVYNDGTVGV